MSGFSSRALGPIPGLCLGILIATFAGCSPNLAVPSSRPSAASAVAPAALAPIAMPAASTIPVLSPTMAANAYSAAQFALMAMTGSNCVSSHEGQMALESIDFEGMGAGIDSAGGVLSDGRGWVGTIADARQHFGASEFVAEDPGEHWFITNDRATINLMFETAGPLAAALIEIPLADGRTVWYLGPRWFVSIPC